MREHGVGAILAEQAELTDGRSSMQIHTTRFGTVDVPADELVTFEDGLPGFPGPRSMALLGAGDMPGGVPGVGHHSLYWLQDAEDPDVAFLTIVPWSAYPDYDIDIDVAGSDPDDLCVLAIVTVRREDGAVKLTANLLAPVVIDSRTKRGHQAILHDQDWPIHAPLAEAQQSTIKAG